MSYEVKTRVIHDTSGLYSQGDVTDRPCPAITIGVGGLNSAHYKVEYYVTDAPPSDERPMTNKPPYRVLSMTEIAALPWNGFTAVSTFSGCGGSSLGYKMAGFKVLWANEFIPAAQEVYRLNHPQTILDTRDIRQVQPSDILDAIGMKPGELDLFDGSPPCASFSTAGKREAGWGKVKKYSDTQQRTDDLFYEYARLVKGVQPKVFIAENVSGLVKGTAKGYFKLILKELEECGYNVRAKVLDAQWLGVPQMRQRLIFVGVRRDLGLEPAFPKPLPYRYTVRDALPWIVRQAIANQVYEDASLAPSPTVLASTGQRALKTLAGEHLHYVEVDRRILVEEANGLRSRGEGRGHVWTDVTSAPMPTVQAQRPVRLGIEDSPRAYRDKRGAYGNDGDITDQPAPTVLADSVGTHWVVEPESDISRFAIGREWDTLAPGEQSKKYFNLTRAPLNGPSPTVTVAAGTAWSPAAAAGVTHPTEKRKFSIAELKRICAFPDDFHLVGTYAQQWERLGRAVPPVMMSYIASTVRDEVLCKLKS